MPYVFDFDHKHRKPPMEHEGPPRRQGRQPGRDDVGTGLPVPPRLHHLDRRLPGLHGRWLARGPRRRGGRPSSSGSRRPWASSSATPTIPLLVWVRSGAKFSMPGMMDTVLNLGLNDESVEGLAKQTGDERFAYDSLPPLHRHVRPHRARLPGEEFDEPFDAAKEQAGADIDAAIPAELLRYLVDAVQADRRGRTGKPFPQDPDGQLRGAIEAVFRSGTAPGPSPTGTASASPTTSAPPSTCRPWCSATATTTRAPASASPATRPRAPRAPTATSWSTPRARTWWPASATPSRSPR